MSRDRVTESLADALKAVLSGPAERRLYRSGKLDGLFPSRGGVNGEAAARALREGFLEVVRTETRGKSSFEWVRLTPRGVEFLAEYESPVRALDELKAVLRANQNALPEWLGEMRQGLSRLSGELEAQARGWMEKLEGLERRVSETLDRLEKRKPALPDDLVSRVPWGPTALRYLDRRLETGLTGACPMPELFEALLEEREDLSVSAFHEGLRHLQERRALRLLPPEEELSRPEFALFDGERVLRRGRLTAGLVS